jgi:formylglycine-generating enzyme required for sulfatase activity
MSGNVFQWVKDYYHSSYNGAPTDGRAWIANCQDGEFSRVLRGGSWNYYPDNLRSADRGSENSIERADYFGFRVARTLTA